MQGLRLTHAFQLVRALCASLAVGAFLVLATSAFADDVPTRERPVAPPNPTQTSPQLDQPEQPQQPRQLEPQQNSQQAQQDEPIRLGIAFDHDADLSQGITVGEVMPGGVAADAGLQAGDVIISIDGEAVTSAEQLDRVVQQHAHGDEAGFVVLRNGERQEMNITFRQLSRGNQGQESTAGNQRMRSHGWLGVTLQREEDQEGQPEPGQQQTQLGAVVASVYPASPAARAGMHPGDRIMNVNGEDVTSVDHLLETLAQTKAGDRIELVVICDGDERNYGATLEDAGVFDVAGEFDPDSPYTWHDPHGFNTQITAEDLMLEQHRLVMEQHERMENMLYEMQDDLEAIRRELGILRDAGTAETSQPAQDQAPTTQQPGARRAPPAREASPPVQDRREQQPTDNSTNPN